MDAAARRQHDVPCLEKVRSATASSLCDKCSAPSLLHCTISSSQNYLGPENHQMYLSTSIQTILLAGVASTSAAILPRQANGTSYAVQTPPLDTDWTYKIGTNPWPEYPRPQLERSQWKNLNGIWRYQNASGTNAVDNPPFGETLEREVLVPSCLESGLSGQYYR